MDNFDLEQLLADGGVTGNLRRLLEYYNEKKGGSVNPREQLILNAYWLYQREMQKDRESAATRWAFWALVNAQHALNSIPRWGSM